MSAPPFLIGAVLVFWGWQSDNLVAGALLAVLLEGARRLKLRFELGPGEHATIADLSTIGFVLLAVLLAANRGVARGVLQAFVWLPVALAPILAAQTLSESGRIPLSALFRYMRKLKREDPSITDPPVDASMVYIALALLAAGVANQRGEGYYAGVVVAAALMLCAARPRQARLGAAALMLAAAAGLGYAGQLGLVHLQARLEEWVLDLGFRGFDLDPFRTRTAMGSIGRVKEYDTILARVYAPEREAARVRLLHRASYNAFAGNTWIARGAPMEARESEADNVTWVLSPGAPEWSTRIAVKLESGGALLPLPAGVVRLGSLPATATRANTLGSVHARLAVDWVQYEAFASDGMAIYAPPSSEDTVVPPEEQAVLRQVAAQLGLAGLAPAEALRRIERHLLSFTYATWRERAPAAGQTALGDFLTRTRAGHCEYFASAATLLARAAGIPARYAVGFAVMERSNLEGAFVVRARHAHAWARAWVEGRWVDLDTTPAAWFEVEEARAPLWEGLGDLLRWAGFRWSQRGEISLSDWWYGVLVVLAVYLVWSVTRGSRRAKKDDLIAGAARRRWPGEDSEFYAVEKSLPAREAAESHAAWVARVAPGLVPEKAGRLREALRLHQRYRFDPAGISATERGELRELCSRLAVAAP